MSARVQAKKLCAGHGGAEHTAGRGDMPAPRIMARRDGVADAALDFGAQDEGVQHRRPGQPTLFRKRQCGRGDRRRGMDDRRQVRVIVVEQVGADRVDECGSEQIEPLRAAEHGDPFGAGQRRENPHGHFDRRRSGDPKGTADEIEERSLALMPHRVRQRIPARRRNEFADALTDEARACLLRHRVSSPAASSRSSRRTRVPSPARGHVPSAKAAPR